MVEVRERRRALDLASVRGKRMVCRVAKVSSARGRGSTPLLVMSMPDSKFQGIACSNSQFDGLCDRHDPGFVLCEP